MRLKSDQFPLRKKTKPFERGDNDGYEETSFKGNEIMISDNRKVNDHLW